MTFTIDAFRLDGKAAVITGAGGRGNSIGRAYAMGLAKAGAAVVVADLNASGAGAVAEEIKAAGGQAVACGVDITDPVTVAQMARTATAAFGGVDILVNNAALMIDATFHPASRVPIEDWNPLDDHIDVSRIDLEYTRPSSGALGCHQRCAAAAEHVDDEVDLLRAVEQSVLDHFKSLRRGMLFVVDAALANQAACGSIEKSDRHGTYFG